MWTCPALPAAVVALPVRLLAQAQGETPAGGATVVSTQQFPYGGLFVVLVMFGLALFAVCRSSRRN